MMNRALEELWLLLISTFVTSVLGGVWWLIRRIFTNQKEISLLKNSLENNERQMGEVVKDVREIRQVLLGPRS